MLKIFSLKKGKEEWWLETINSKYWTYSFVLEILQWI